MKRTSQIEDLLKSISNVNDEELQEVEKSFMKVVRSAARKIKVDEIREALKEAGIIETKDNGKTLNILLGYPDAPEEFFNSFKPYSEEEEKKIVNVLEEMGLKFSTNTGPKRGPYESIVIRVEI